MTRRSLVGLADPALDRVAPGEVPA